MPDKRYINVILPLKLGWEPFYSLAPDSEMAQVGDRVLVPFAGHSYLGVVSAVDRRPDASMRVKEAYGLQKHKDRVSEQELDFWRALASYYMCSVGEVYKAAYPSVKDESVRVRKNDSEYVAAAESFRSLPFDFGKIGSKPFLLSCADSQSMILEMVLRTLQKGENVLWLVPEIKLSKALEKQAKALVGSALLTWGANITPSRKREVARCVRGEGRYVVLGTRSALFLPHRNLGLIVVQEEHEASYKQSSPAPRYNGRDAAILLSGIHKAKVVLESETPSFESVFNVSTGKYDSWMDASFRNSLSWDIVDTRAELMKNGMRTHLSIRMIQAARAAQGNANGISVPVAFYKPRRAAFPKMEELLPQLQAEFGPDVFVTDDLVEKPIPGGVRMLGIFGADSLLGRHDFRADERLIQTIMQAVVQCREIPLGEASHAGEGMPTLEVVIHTREASHPVFSSLSSGDVSVLVGERREFGYPPFMRIVDMVVRDEFAQRGARMTDALASRLFSLGFASLGIASLSSIKVIPMPGYGVRVILPRDKMLVSRKETMRSLLEDFEKAEKYASHVYFDVDPQ